MAEDGEPEGLPASLMRHPGNGIGGSGRACQRPGIRSLAPVTDMRVIRTLAPQHLDYVPHRTKISHCWRRGSIPRRRRRKQSRNSRLRLVRICIVTRLIMGKQLMR